MLIEENITLRALEAEVLTDWAKRGKSTRPWLQH